MRTVNKDTAIEKIKEICNYYKVPIQIYSEGDFPEGRQTNEDVISLKRNLRFTQDGYQQGFVVSYSPWIRVMGADLSIAEFESILEQGERVKSCIVELDDYLSNTLII